MKRVLSLFLISLYFFPVLAQNKESSEGLLNKLLAPGPLIEGHLELEQIDCLKCHDAGKGVPNSKCLDCHKEIGKFVDQKTGFHGKQTKSCRQCHVDHKGRGFDTTLVDQDEFDHKETGYKLEGKHAKIDCIKCHQEKRTKKAIRKTALRYMGLTAKCIDCHRKEETHFFKGKWAKKDCGTCHGLKDWKKDIKFDHERDAEYKFSGKHKELKCTKCHLVNKRRKISKYEWPQLKTKQCLSCHKDIHKNNLSPKFRNQSCNKCHNETSWKIKTFDHKMTRFELRGQHAKLDCTKCHKQTSAVVRRGKKHYQWSGLKNQCISCHKDYHRFGKHQTKKFKNLNNCSNCHSDGNDWRESHDFDHDLDTRWTIDGKHEKLKCTNCHLPKKPANKKAYPVRKPTYKWKTLNTKTCATCHKSTHDKEFSKKFLSKKCIECHVTTGWKDRPYKQKKSFKHSETRFKLTGKHKKISCNQCHNRGLRKIFKFKNYEKGFCISCHKNEHEKQFTKKFYAKSCSDCHTTNNFTKLKSFNHSQTNFELQNRHKKLNCSSCHKATKVKFERKPYRKKNQFIFPEFKERLCITCHVDYHREQLGTKCTTCHTPGGVWKKTLFDHQKHSNFKLKYKHEKVKCIKCHLPIKGEYVEIAKKKVKLVRYKPLPNACFKCHKDQHNGERGTDCAKCHSEKDFKIARDFHKDFTLHGAHFTIDCSGCHQDNRRLSGMSDNCLFCHQRDDVHNGSLPDCQQCHKQQFWENADFKHSRSEFPLRGVHRTLDCSECHSRGIYEGTPSECIDCHLQDAQAVTSPPHLIPAFENCKQCHNQFTFN